MRASTWKWTPGLFLSLLLIGPAVAVAADEPLEYVDDAECPDARVSQTPIDIGPCSPDSLDVCWRVRELEATSATPEEDSCRLKDDLSRFDIGRFCVSPMGKNGSYPARFATYLVRAGKDSPIESVSVQRQGEKFRWSMSSCPKLKVCEHNGGSITPNCEHIGVPRGAQGRLVGNFIAIFQLHEGEKACPQGSTKIASNPTLCQGPVRGIFVKGKAPSSAAD